MPMWTIRHLPWLFQGLWLLGVLAVLASLGINTWAFLLGHDSGEVPTQLHLVGWAILELGLLYNWMVIAYNVRFAPDHHRAHSAPWLDSVRGQRISAVVGGVVALTTVAAALMSPPPSPLMSLAVPFSILFLVVWYAVFAWAML
jgi:hypothetical protein